MNLELTNEDFSDCILDTYGDDKRDMDVLESYPILSKLEGFDYDFSDFDEPDEEKNKTIKFINYFYSNNRAIEQKHPEYKERKAACAVAAGFYYSPQDGQFQAHVADMVNGKNVHVNRMIISFIRHNYNDKFTTLAHIRDTFYTKLASEDAMEVIDLKRILEVEEMMETLRFKLLRGDETPQISVALLRKFEEVSLDCKPEDIAFKIRDGKNPVNIEVYK